MDTIFVLQPARMASEPRTDLQYFIHTAANVQSSSATMQIITDVKLEPFCEVLFSKIAHYCVQMCTLYSHKCSNAKAKIRLPTLQIRISAYD